jgi:hypothetical protein
LDMRKKQRGKREEKKNNHSLKKGEKNQRLRESSLYCLLMK